ncbi:MAG: H-type lectin domain-containing protein, partial [Desulfobacterales bacterium]|nr:H-type lectin domain-containing protein [Desulfobacterales bacterium]
MTQVIDSGKTIKNSAIVTINFHKPFKKPPTVTVTPFWENHRAEVREIDTITDIDMENFTVVSGNAAPDY